MRGLEHWSDSEWESLRVFLEALSLTLFDVDLKGPMTADQFLETLTADSVGVAELSKSAASADDVLRHVSGLDRVPAMGAGMACRIPGRGLGG